jgi:type II secretory pathway component PulK
LGKTIIHSKRGVALLIVLLVTALLIALIFEFAYATRISLNSAVNFRDSQRAYFLARSGVYAFIRFNNKLVDLKKLIPQGEWGVVPIISGGDTELRVRWEDEAGKIMITDVKTNPNTQSIVKTLFENKSIDTVVYDRMVDPSSTINSLSLLTGLHQYMSDEDYNKVSDCLTVSPVSQQGQKYININTASADVLQALGIGSGEAQLIMENRSRNPYTLTTMPDSVKAAMVPGLRTTAAVNFLTDQSNFYKVYAYATVGGYTKQIEAIVNMGNPLNPVLYWREL